ncbi:hypothetical protein V1512DRAFT_275615 [Lipomyces arxii]|uniref:uncharacterized protein n=1 Tax=Lipomyces arxii TaxID=56418 RepID=UPI0034CD5660
MRRGHTVIGLTQSPEKFGERPKNIHIPETADKRTDADVVVNAYGPHSTGHDANRLLKCLAKYFLASKKAGVEYVVIIEFLGRVPPRIADSNAHVYYMEDRLGPVGTSLREFCNARLAIKVGTATTEDE